MFAERWLYDLLIYLYALSLAFSFSDLLHRSGQAWRIGTGLHFLVWLLMMGRFLAGMLELVPFSVRVDTLYIYSLALVTFTLALSLNRRMALFSWIANLVGFLVLVLNLFFARGTTSEFQNLLLTELVFVHVTTAVFAYVALSLSSIGAGLYLLENHLLKKRKWNRLLDRLPSLGSLEMVSTWLVAGGILFLLVSLVLGILYAYQTVGAVFWKDPKPWSSLVVVAVYGWVLVGRHLFRWPIRRQAWWNALALLFLVANYLVPKLLRTSFHHWI
ncbi:cytochrome C assembly family protein [Staphylospora marina]|uniref:cytochrome C assembly family protein n=1 Tax=Staphylospora marina TaxID=2490858 RepID=UPI000F5C051B|nr:cytochrome c biogenesis protein CcsA [Staphylospora marina]